MGSLSKNMFDTKVWLVQMSAFYHSSLDMKETIQFPEQNVSPGSFGIQSGGSIPLGKRHEIVYEQAVAAPITNLMAFDLSQDSLELMIQFRLWFDCSSVIDDCRQNHINDSEPKQTP